MGGKSSKEKKKASKRKESPTKGGAASDADDDAGEYEYEYEYEYDGDEDNEEGKAIAAAAMPPSPLVALDAANKTDSGRSKDDGGGSRHHKRRKHRKKTPEGKEVRHRRRRRPKKDGSDGNDGDDEGGDVVFSKDPNKKVSKDDFELLKVIGKGSFAKVMQVQHKASGKVYAMKVLRKDAIIERNQVTHTKNERSILQKIQHPFIVTLHWAFQTPEKLYLVLDYVNGGELFFHLKREGKFDEDRVRLYVAEIVSAISHLHSLDIIYRDMKPENILIDMTGHVVITDFGLSKEISDEEGTSTFCGTPEYLAPEVLKGEGHGKAVDWWSLGTLTFEMLTGLPPFFSDNINMMYQMILTSEPEFPADMSPAARSLLEGLLTRDVEDRLGSPQAGGEGKIKAHEFFASIDWEKLDRREIEPSWRPPVTDEHDVGQIDTAFTTERAEDSDDDDQAGTHFDNFTFDESAAVGLGS